MPSQSGPRWWRNGSVSLYGSWTTGCNHQWQGTQTGVWTEMELIFNIHWKYSVNQCIGGGGKRKAEYRKYNFCKGFTVKPCYHGHRKVLHMFLFFVSQAFSTWALGSEDWAATPHVSTLNNVILILTYIPLGPKQVSLQVSVSSECAYIIKWVSF